MPYTADLLETCLKDEFKDKSIQYHKHTPPRLFTEVIKPALIASGATKEFLDNVVYDVEDHVLTNNSILLRCYVKKPDISLPIITVDGRVLSKKTVKTKGGYKEQFTWDTFIVTLSGGNNLEDIVKNLGTDAAESLTCKKNRFFNALIRDFSYICGLDNLLVRMVDEFKFTRAELLSMHFEEQQIESAFDWLSRRDK